ncbi:DUF551 domain-containing protein [Caballeronia sp. NCTM5]|uniref:DUF551 domain-containing protein n=1 Tax=Caballeronia sp. NCTM5 TaxID=2921755 RepID=UPI0020299005|nr:DUF551 domain-containing protein [Caballeronia sp. NCTM5]
MTDEQQKFEAWAISEGLISESHGVRFVNSMCDTAKKAWQARAALDAAGASEGQAVGYVNIRALTQLADGCWAIINPRVEGDATHALYTHPSAEIAALRERIAGMEKDAGWISVKDRLPDAPGDYLLFRPAAHLPPASDPNITIREFFGRGKVGNDRFGGAHAITHWMPLPAAPDPDSDSSSGAKSKD